MTSEANIEKILADLKLLSLDAEALLQGTAGQAGEKAGELRDRLAAALDAAKASCERAEGKVAAGAGIADKTIREHPYESLAVAFGVGLVVGVLVGRR